LTAVVATATLPTRHIYVGVVMQCDGNRNSLALQEMEASLRELVEERGWQEASVAIGYTAGGEVYLSLVMDVEVGDPIFPRVEGAVTAWCRRRGGYAIEVQVGDAYHGSEAE